MQIFPESVQMLWNKWQLRCMVLTSLSLQIILVVIGKSRQHRTKNFIRIIQWLAYLSADSVATASLGVLSNNHIKFEEYIIGPYRTITAFWAPFLLLHLGGPDTITAYSLEDNELWLRHFLGLAVQVGGSAYVFYRSWTSAKLNFVAIPMFIAAIIKYGERTWVLRSASRKHFRHSMLPHPDPGPNYTRFMEEYDSKKDEGFKVHSEKSTEARIEEGHSSAATEVDTSIPEVAILSKAYNFFEIFKNLPADLILTFHDIKKSQSFIQKSSCDEAFKVIEVELGFMYDVFYTKAALGHSTLGHFLRLTTICCTVGVFIAFLMIEKHIYFRVDVKITYILLIGAILLETYAVVVQVCSDWTIISLSKHKNFVVALLYRVISSITLPRHKRWSNAIGQFNLIRNCLKEKPGKSRLIQSVLQISELYWLKNSVEVPPELKTLIFEELLKKIEANVSDLDTPKKLCACRGGRVLQVYAKRYDKIGEENLNLLKSSVEVEFDESILLWHIATDLCYYSDQKENPLFVYGPYCKGSKLISDYMMFLLDMCPFMLPNGIGEIRFRDTCAEARQFFKERKSITNGIQACTKLIEVNTKIPPSKVKGDRSKSVLFHACMLAHSLQSLKTHYEKEKMWELVGQVWVEMLSYAASQCGWRDHARQLRRGGELLTHVWLLMAHLGLTQQFQISRGHERVKLIVQ